MEGAAGAARQGHGPGYFVPGYASLSCRVSTNLARWVSSTGVRMGSESIKKKKETREPPRLGRWDDCSGLEDGFWLVGRNPVLGYTWGPYE